MSNEPHSDRKIYKLAFPGMADMPLKFRLQTYIRTTFIGLASATVLFLFMGILFYKCCSCESKFECSKTRVSALARVSCGACIDVYGSVLGDVIPGSRVNLFAVSSTEFSVVMKEIRTRKPIEWSTVDERKRFRFMCLSQGDYAFVIPASSYNRSVGAPFPYEFEYGNLVVDIAFLGDDWQYGVGAFSINESCREG